MSDVLEITGLSVDFLQPHGWARVVQDVSLSVAPGELVGLVGESGSGKTVTCLSITQLLPRRTSRIAAGSIVLDGTELTGLTERRMEDVRGREVGMIFQEPMTSLNPSFRVGEQIAEVLRRHRGMSGSAAARRAVELLDSVGIPAAAARARAYPHQLSGGMRQRVMIAIALSCEPKLLIADEPTTALDVTVQAQVLDLIRQMARDSGTAVLFVTHDLGVVADLCDRVVVMYAGEVVEQAAVDDLFESPGHPYTRALLRSMPQVGARQGRLPVLPGSAPRAGSMPPGCRFEPRCIEALPECAAAPVTLTTTPTGSSRCVRAEAATAISGPAPR
jgi:oligopeptide/dipeptide ABC transporter ATP-binding protein